MVEDYSFMEKYADKNIIKIKNPSHRNCFVCSKSNPRGLGLDFYYDKDEKFSFSRFRLEGWSQGYEGMPHGGIISAIFDGAMGNCLFAQGLTGVTAELNVRFKQTIEPDKETTVKAWVKNSSNALYILESEIVQDSRVRAIAVGKFVDKPEFRNSQD